MNSSAALNRASQYEYRYQENSICFNPSRNSLFVSGERRHLEPQSEKILALLLFEPRKTVPLRKILGQDGEQSFDNALWKLRRELGEFGNLIKSIRSQGYEFRGDVSRRIVTPISKNPDKLVQGKSIDAFELVERLASNEGIEVWLARNETGRDLSVKFALTEAAERRLESEGSIWKLIEAKKLTRPPFPELVSYGYAERPKYLCFEYGGNNLEQWSAIHLESLSKVERIDLFFRMIDAVRQVHNLGVVHRDLKPANLLVRTFQKQWQVLIVDLGSARHVEREQFTKHKILPVGLSIKEYQSPTGDLGTLNYAAPEILGRQVGDARSDVFSLGVILYQLVVGDPAKPMIWPSWQDDIEDPALVELLQMATHGEIEQRHTLNELESALLNLDSRRREIIALEKYHKLKMQRPWIWTAGSALLLAITASSIFAYQTQQALAQVRLEESQKSQAIEFMSNVLRHADPRQNLSDPNPSLISALMRATSLMDNGSPQDPETRLTLSNTLGRIFGGMGQLELQLHEAWRSVRLAESIWGEYDERTLREHFHLVVVLARTGDIPQAEKALQNLSASVSSFKEDSGKWRFFSEMTYGHLRSAQLNFKEAAAHYRDAEELYRSLGMDESLLLHSVMYSYAQSLARSSEFEKAFSLLTQLISETPTPTQWLLMDAQVLRAQISGFSGYPEQSITILEKELPILARVYGENSMKFATALTVLAQQQSAIGDNENAISSYKRAETTFCDQNIGLATMCRLLLGNLGVLQLEEGDTAGARISLKKVYADIAEAEPDNAVALNYYSYWLAHAELSLGSLEEAKALSVGLVYGNLEAAAPGAMWQRRLRALEARISCYEQPNDRSVADLKSLLTVLADAGLSRKKISVIDTTPLGNAMDL